MNNTAATQTPPSESPRPLTRREFDRLTKENWGCRMARDERCSYRERRLLEHSGSGADFESFPYGPGDYLAHRAWRMRDLVRCGCSGTTLGIGSPFRYPQAWRAAHGLPLLAGRRFWVG